MLSSKICGVRIAGISSALPQKKVDNTEYCSVFDEETVRKTIESTGVRSTYHSVGNQTASDLAYIAAKNLLESKGIEPSEIGILIYICAHHDYIAPATAFVLQKQLGIPEDSMVFDINLGCSGFVYGLQVGASLLKNSAAEKALILLGDSSSRVVSPKDTSRLLFGDSGAALLLQKTMNDSDVMTFGLKSDGTRYNEIYVPAGGFRHMNGSHELRMEEDGRERSDYHSHMNGTNVFVFSVTDVPALVREFMKDNGISFDEVDNLFMHQPNLFIIKNLLKKLKLSEEKAPMTIDKYGNTSAVSIPITMCDVYGNKNDGKKKVVMLGFGIGLSWGVSYAYVDTEDILPVVFTDYCFEDGLLDD
ncbi:MAG: ketoacyl-ACP synthase III [Clostridiales bacterium]|nr:ketoacyl-ACP synthase III [Clostridiales bacterium]